MEEVKEYRVLARAVKLIKGDNSIEFVVPQWDDSVNFISLSKFPDSFIKEKNYEGLHFHVHTNSPDGGVVDAEWPIFFDIEYSYSPVDHWQEEWEKLPVGPSFSQEELVWIKKNLIAGIGVGLSDARRLIQTVEECNKLIEACVACAKVLNGG